jgi:hypothetical protein
MRRGDSSASVMPVVQPKFPKGADVARYAVCFSVFLITYAGFDIAGSQDFWWAAIGVSATASVLSGVYHNIRTGGIIEPRGAWLFGAYCSGIWVVASFAVLWGLHDIFDSKPNSEFTTGWTLLHWSLLIVFSLIWHRYCVAFGAYAYLTDKIEEDIN